MRRYLLSRLAFPSGHPINVGADIALRDPAGRRRTRLRARGRRPEVLGHSAQSTLENDEPLMLAPSRRQECSSLGRSSRS